MRISRIPSTARNASGITTLLLAESSRVLSNHCSEAVIAGLEAKLRTNLLSAVALSQRIGFLLYVIADEPPCVFSNGSSISFRFASRRRSLHSLCADCATDARQFTTRVSTFRW